MREHGKREFGTPLSEDERLAEAQGLLDEEEAWILTPDQEAYSNKLSRIVEETLAEHRPEGSSES